MIILFFTLLLITFLILALLNPLLILPVFFFLISAVVLVYAKKKLGNWLNLFSLISLIYIFGFIIRYITLIYGYNHFNIPTVNLTFTLIYSFAVFLIFLIGNLIGFNIRTTSHLKILQINKIEAKIIMYTNFLISLGASLLILFMFGGWSGLVSNFSDKSTSFAGMGIFFVFLSSFAICIILLLSIGSIKINFKILILIIISLLPLIGTGGRILLILVALSYILSYEFSYRRIKLYQLIGLSIIGLAFYLAYFSYFRVYSLTGSWQYLSDNITELYYNTLVNGALSFIDGLNVIMYYVPDQVNYLGGYSLLAGMLIFIPSFLITNKPENTAFLYNITFNGSHFSNGAGTGQNPSLIGEVYWNLGPINTLLIFLILGILIGIIYKKAYSVNFNPKYLTVIILIFLIPIAIFTIKSGISSGTPYRILIPLFYNIIFLFLLKKIGWRRDNV